MKNRLYFLIAVVIMLCFMVALVACDSTRNDDRDDDEEEEETLGASTGSSDITTESSDITTESSTVDTGADESGETGTEDSEHIHTEEIIPAVNASCTQTGLTEGKKCSECGEILVEQTLIEALSHNYGDGYACVVCNHILQASEGLVFVLDKKTDTYYVAGIGTCTDSDIIIPYTYEGKAVTGIGHSAFSGLSTVQSVTVPNSVLFIAARAFYDCTSLTDITLGSGVSQIGENAFDKATSLARVNYGGEIEDWCKIPFNNIHDNPLANKAALYINGAPLVDLVIPSTVTSLGDYSFVGCTSIKTVTMEDGVTNIGDYAFYRCSGIESVILGNSVKFVDALAFAECTALCRVVIPKSIEQMGYGAFLSVENVKTVEFLGDIEDWCKVSFEAGGCANLLEGGAELYINGELLVNLVIPDTITEIKAYTFCHCNSIKSVVVPSSVTAIGERAFYQCDSIEEITLGQGVLSIGEYAFHNCNLKKVIYNGSLENWCNIDFCGYSASPMSGLTELYIDSEPLTEVVLPEGITAIKNHTFQNCKSIVSVTIPNSITSIGDYAFFECVSISSISLPEGVTSIGNSAFLSCESLASLSLGSSLTSIGKSAFGRCGLIESVVLPNTLETIGDEAFSDCYLKHVTMPTLATQYIPKNTLETVIFTSGTEIPQKAFYQCSSLKSVTIPESVKAIGSEAFYSCYSLNEIYYNAVMVDDLGNNSGAFRGAGGDDGIVLYIGDCVTKIPAYLFAGAEHNVAKIKSVIFKGDSACQSIGDGAFYYCKSLTSIVFEGGSVCKTIGDKAFSNCTSLTQLEIPSTVTSIGYWSFENCDSIKEARIPTAAISYVSKRRLQTLELTDGDAIPNESFSGCGELRSVVISGNISTIGQGAFRGCSALLSVTVGSNVTGIGEEAFQYCNKLVEVYNLSRLGISMSGAEYAHGYIAAYAKAVHLSLVEESILKSVDGEFIFAIVDGGIIYLIDYVGNETEITLPQGYGGSAYKIYQYAFNCAVEITSVAIPSSVTGIGRAAFSNCKSLMAVTLENPNGWRADTVEIIASDLADSSTAANYLTSEYAYCEWSCEE